MKIKQILEGLTDEQVDQFHTELDDLVHKHLGHSSDEEVDEEKQRLDPKCWDGYKIGNPKTKMKGGKRVNNCVPK